MLQATSDCSRLITAKYKTWCCIIVSVVTAVTEASAGADVSLDVCVQLN